MALKNKISVNYSPTVLIATLLICLVTTLGIIQARNLGWLESWDLLAYDAYINYASTAPSIDDNIVIIAINEQDIQSRAEWPLSDSSLAQLLQTLTQYSPSVIGVDIYRDRLIPPGTAELVNIIQSNENIYLVEKFSANLSENAIRPHPALVNASQTGFSDMLIDNDGVVRRGLLFLNNEEAVYYALSLRLALTFLSTYQIQLMPDPNFPSQLMLNQVTYPPLEKNDGGYVDLDASGYQYLLSFENGVKDYRQLSLSDVLSGQHNLAFIQDKVVLIGVISESVKDTFITPRSKQNQSGFTPGVVLHAHATAQLINSALKHSRPMGTVSEQWEVTWIVCWALLGLVFAISSTSILRYMLLFSTGVLVLFISSKVMFSSGYWLPIIAPLSAYLDVFLLVSGFVYIQEKRQRSMVMDLFARHVSVEVANEVWTQREDFFKDGRLKSQQATATILFTDLVGYTSTVEKMDPEALMAWLNEYMEIMANCVIEHGGMIDDYYGDAIKANFGVPLIKYKKEEIQADAISAVKCAIEMKLKMQNLNEARLKENLTPLGMRIGIATGSIIVGSLGSRQRLKYTSIGDVVNIAARLESYGRELAQDDYCTILIAESTEQYLGSDFDTICVGELALKGKTGAIKAYQLMGQLK